MPLERFTSWKFLPLHVCRKMQESAQFYADEIPKVQLKAVSKFRIPINKPSQNKLKAILLYRQQKKELILLNDTTEVPPVIIDVKEANTPLSKASRIAKILEIQRQTARLTEIGYNLQKEEENLRRSNVLIKNEIASLNDVQGSLLWLLKKANQFETQRNHFQ